MPEFSPESCVSGCKFCFIHPLGVYILIPGTFILIVAFGWIYWDELTAFCSGRMKPLSGDSARVPLKYNDTGPQFQQPLDLDQGPDAVLVQGADAQLMGQSPDQPVIESPPPPIIVSTPATVTSPTPPPPSQPVSPSSRPATKAPLSPLSKNVTKTRTETRDGQETVKDHESTGSNYYRQMMQGKKNVASISQYNIRGKHKKTKDGKKKHHHHHKGDKKK